MKNFIKTPILLLLTIISFQACTSEENIEETTSSELAISQDLAAKIIETANYKNDYNFLVYESANSSCEFPSMRCYFSNPEGDYFVFNTYEESLEDWLTTYNQIKTEILSSTGIAFTNEDFFIDQMDLNTGFLGMSTREEFIEYFESCNDGGIGTTVEYGVPFLEAYLNCDNTEKILALSGESLTVTDTQDLPAIQEFLQGINANNNTNYSLEDITLFSIYYKNIYDSDENINETDKLLNYFDDCLFNRDTTNTDCLNFVYPLELNRFNLQLEEVVTTTIETDEALAEAFGIDVGELGFVYPIELLGGNGSVITIENNEALENALNNPANYCN
ncbi:hypothetical protein [Neotamlana laminarinivorans]|uniref:Uncharacterized protein n=1 Tax=Neotamlana laminarinivorans TaxID=2883124 RepID=A0A9X1L1P6_9FLAO|nr:hypothetical protein [Tamlana laminarinivorans]MCB4798943.1 hypothetical protein [Tamlana laminarinivorans]